MTFDQKVQKKGLMVSRINSGDHSIKLYGFTLIELLVVLSVVGLLMLLVAPNYVKQHEKAKEVVLLHNLKILRESMDEYRGDYGKEPNNLSDLVKNGYLKEIPIDPITGRCDSWMLVPIIQDGGLHMDAYDDDSIPVDVRSGAKGNGLDGSEYFSW